jgi:hypothetical protein
MKNLIITIGILLSTLSNSVYAQTLIGKSFNKKFADSLLIVKINEKRVSLGFTPFYKSNNVSNYISKRNCTIMASGGPAHPEYKWETDPELKKKMVLISKEYAKVNKNTNHISPTTQEPYGVIFKEVAAYGEGDITTYESLIDRVINGWYNSLGHRALLLRDDHSLHFNEVSFLGVSIQVIGDRFFATANIISF